MPFSERTLRSILASNTPRAADRDQKEKRAIQFGRDLYEWGPAVKRVMIFGSFAKGTTIKGGADVDLFVSLTSLTQGTLREMSDKLFRWLREKKRYIVRRQNVSSRVHVGPLKIDVVPGKRQSPKGNDHSLWSRDLDSYIKTNIIRQVRYVAGSGRQDEIRLAKIWRDAHDLDCPSFLLELAVVRALYGKRHDQLADNFATVLAYLAFYFAGERLVDPGNGANVVSSALSDQEKTAVVQAAQRSLSASSTPAAFRK